MSASGTNNDMRRALMLDRLLRSWNKVPEKRLGQLIVDGLDMDTLFDVMLLRSIPDHELLDAIERYVLSRG
jgi:hypothetical protein